MIPKPRKGTTCPAPWDVRTARHNTGLTMDEAGAAVYVDRHTWLAWERDYDHKDHQPMHPAFAELFALKTGLTELPPILKTLKGYRGER